MKGCYMSQSRRVRAWPEGVGLTRDKGCISGLGARSLTIRRISRLLALASRSSR